MKRFGFSRQFGVKTLLGLMVVAALGSLALNRYLQTRPPIQHSYSPTELQQYLREGRPVLVTIDADWAMNPTNRPRYMSTNVSREIRKREIVAMTADWTIRSPNVDELLDRINVNRIPALAIFSPDNPENPIVFPRDASDFQILSAIERLTFK